MEKNSQKRSIIRGLQRSTQMLKDDQTKRSIKIIFEACTKMKNKQYKQALDLLQNIVKDEKYNNNKQFIFQLKYHIILITMRLPKYSLAEVKVQTLLGEIQNYQNKADKSHQSLRFRILTTQIIIKIILQKYEDLENSMDKLIQTYSNLNEEIKRQSYNEFCVKILGFQNFEDTTLITHFQSQNAYQDELISIYKMISDEYDEAKYYMIKALQRWKQKKNYKNCIVCISFIIHYNNLMQKNNDFYIKQLEKMKKIEKVQFNLQKYIERVNNIIIIIKKIQLKSSIQQQTQQEKKRNYFNAKLFKLILIKKINKELQNINKKINTLQQKLNSSKLKSMQTENPKEIQAQIQSFQETMIYLSKFGNDVNSNQKQEVFFILLKYKYSWTIYRDMKRRLVQIRLLLKKFLLMYYFRVIKTHTHMNNK